LHEVARKSGSGELKTTGELELRGGRRTAFARGETSLVLSHIKT